MFLLKITIYLLTQNLLKQEPTKQREILVSTNINYNNTYNEPKFLKAIS